MTPSERGLAREEGVNWGIGWGQDQKDSETRRAATSSNLGRAVITREKRKKLLGVV